MSIISSFCETNPETVQQFMQAPKGSVLHELRRLVQEFNASFGLYVSRVSDNTASRPAARLVTADGLMCGHCMVEKVGVKDGKSTFRYSATMPTIRKQKSSANSDRDSRDSTSLTTLIRAIKSNDEAPTDKKLLEAFGEGMKYTMRAVANASKGRPRLMFDSDVTLAVTRFILGVDSQLSNMYISSLQDKFNQFQSEMQLFEAANADYARYARGVTLVCINTHENKPHYFVADATFDSANDRFDIQGRLKRYASLADSPIADLAVMIKSYMQGTQHYDQYNDLGVTRTDRFFPEIDIASGYARHQELWVAIPKNAQ